VAVTVIASALVFGTSTARAEETVPDAAADGALRTSLAALAQRGAFAEILTAADATLSERDESVPAWAYRGFALHKLGRPLAAESAYRRTIELDPTHWWAFTQLGAVLSSRGRWEEAVQPLERAVRLKPDSLDAHRKLALAHRGRGGYREAVAAVERAVEAGVEQAWAHAELGYLHFALQNSAASAEHWAAAARTGADAREAAYGRALAEWDRGTRGDDEDTRAITRMKREEGPGWVFDVEGMQIRTRLGPTLPPGIASLMKDLPALYRGFVGADDKRRSRITVHLARTYEEHEVARRRLFPQGSAGRAFMSRTFASVPRKDGQRGRPRLRWQLDIYANASAAGIGTSLSHELAHTALQAVAPQPPLWADEGLATYLEVSPREGGLPATGEVRADLIAAWSKAHQAGTLLSFPRMLGAGRAVMEGPEGRARYAQAWSMVHFLLHRDGGASREAFLAYLSSPASRVRDPVDRFTRTVSRDLEGLEREWLAYVEGMGGR